MYIRAAPALAGDCPRHALHERLRGPATTQGVGAKLQVGDSNALEQSVEVAAPTMRFATNQELIPRMLSQERGNHESHGSGVYNAEFVLASFFLFRTCCALAPTQCCPSTGIGGAHAGGSARFQVLRRRQAPVRRTLCRKKCKRHATVHFALSRPALQFQISSM